jgi:hypothetical protein
MTERTTAGDLRSRLRLAGVFAALLLLAGLAYYFACISPRRGFAVSFWSHGYQTNANGILVSLFAVSNAEPHKVAVLAGTEFGLHMIDFGGGIPKILESGEVTVLPICPTRAYPQSRPVLQCATVYRNDLLGRANLFIDTHLMKWKVSDRIYVMDSAKSNGPTTGLHRTRD